ncbi:MULTISPECIES: GNAT family N-acetyltransferase [Bacillus]|uniref:GNAT family N-acetyltransferase n=1 Tax=Bacillus TaxID=1386 RepID=UPI001583A18F|nr:GNAT family N-acetyltransferase [Bacillus glycinifermentans]MBU8788219.1 GNAT family N-acetyltransferase [Bacillus glycinifermentans]NUJ18461.1 GNAT family N-acetyltransferase [Bacillus glycinifermentans]
MNSRPFSASDLAFFEELIRFSPEWAEEELSGEPVKSYMQSYAMYNGSWLVWEDDGRPAAVSFHLEWAPSNGKPWLGTLLVHPDYRRKGRGKTIIGNIGSRLKNAGHKALFAAVPFDRDEWQQMLAHCGFEQLKTEKDEKGNRYLIMVYPLTHT